MTVPDLVVAGGGIAGLTMALEGARRGMRVVVIDQPRPGAASRASAGMLAPSVEGLAPDAARAALHARDFYPGFLNGLRERTEMDVPLDRNGILEVPRSHHELEALSARAPTAERLDADALASLEPALAGHPGAVLHPSDGSVDNVALMAALDVAIARQPRITRATDEVSSLDTRGNLPAFLGRGGTRYQGQHLLLAGGAWSASLPGLPRALPVRPVKGQLIRLDAHPVQKVVYVGGGYLVPRGEATIVGATSEETGLDTSTTQRGLRDLRAIAALAVPALGRAPVLGHWAGLRPISSDGLPIVGRDPDFPALSYACGYSRNGILFAPWLADRLGAQLVGGELDALLLPFSLERFAQ